VVIDKLAKGGRLAVAIGVAGSGKSTLLKPLVHVWRAEGRTVHGIALAWRQADDQSDADTANAERPGYSISISTPTNAYEEAVSAVVALWLRPASV
jgi:molybdopterin-guanine dinucleotide biosynthesis protein